MRRLPDGHAHCRWNDGREAIAEMRYERDHRWGPDNVLQMTYLRVGKKAAGRLLDGRTWDEFPA